jgi:hypothetical protein
MGNLGLVSSQRKPCKVGGSPRGSNRLKLYNGHGNVEATKALFAGCRGKQVKTFVPISLSIAIELSTTNITKLSNYVQSVQVLWSQPSSSLANESKFPEHSGKLKMLIKSCLSVVLTSTVYWLSNVSAKMGCSLYLVPLTRTGEQIINNYTLAFFDRYLNSQNSPLLNSPASNYPEVQSSSRLVTGSNVDQLTVNTHNSLQITKVELQTACRAKPYYLLPAYKQICQNCITQIVIPQF